jgi:hypothetical protein
MVYPPKLLTDMSVCLRDFDQPRVGGEGELEMLRPARHYLTFFVRVYFLPDISGH